jgi:hypothetical protein
MDKMETLRQCTVEGTIVKLPPVQLERNIYLEVKKALELIGGKWKGGKTQGFVFEQDPADLLAQIAGGEDSNLKKEFQFFETPAALADRLVEFACISEDDSILEPSAGRGAIVNAIHRKFPLVTVCGYEIMELNRSFLAKLDRFSLLGSDFLAECQSHFDVMIANPPFAKNQDIDHIRHMEDMLWPGGRLVSVASTHWQFADGKKEQAFRKWLTEQNAEIIPIEAGTFKDSGTMVAACVIVIRKFQ